MIKFSKSERNKLHHIEHEEHELRNEVKHEEKSFMAKLRNVGSKKAVTLLIGTMSFFLNQSKAYADSDKVKRELTNFYEWFSANNENIKNKTIKYESVLDRFEQSFKNLEKEIQKDIKKHDYEKALNNLKFFHKMAAALNDNSMKSTIYKLIIDIETELVRKDSKIGVYNTNNKIYVVGTVNTSDYNIARRMSTSEAQMLVVRELGKMRGTPNRSEATVRGTRLSKFYKLKSGGYKYIISIDLVDDAETTRQLLSFIPKVNLE